MLRMYCMVCTRDDNNMPWTQVCVKASDCWHAAQKCISLGWRPWEVWQII